MMTYDDVKACFPAEAKFFYWGVTQAELDALAVDHWAGQTCGTWYLGTPVAVAALAGKVMVQP